MTFFAVPTFAQGPLGPPIGGNVPRTAPKPRPAPQSPVPKSPAPKSEEQPPLPPQVPTKTSGGLGQPFGSPINPADQLGAMFGDGENSHGIEMSLWPEDMEVINGLLQWRVNIVRFSPLTSSLYRTPVRLDGFITGVGKVSATFVLNQDGTCTSVLAIAGAPKATIRIACSQGPGIMFRVLKPPRQTRWIGIAAVYRETEGLPTVVREYLADMRTGDVWQVSDFTAEGFVVGECDGEAKVLWNSESAQRLGLHVSQCINTALWPSDEGRLAGGTLPPDVIRARPAAPPPPLPNSFQNPPPASAAETARWISQYSDNFLGQEVRVNVNAPARVRTLPTSDGSSVLGSLPVGTTTAGRWVVGRDPNTRWLKQTDTKGYVWEGNLSEVQVYGPVRPGSVDISASRLPFPTTLAGLLSRIDALNIRIGPKLVARETVAKYGGTSNFALIAANTKYAELANAAYLEDPDVKGWSSISSQFRGLTDNIDSGFRAHVFRSSDEVVIAIMGSDPGKGIFDNREDWFYTNALLGAAQKPDIEKLFQAVRVGCECNPTLTGHSLGGGLTQYIAVKFGAKGISFDPAPFADSNTQQPGALPNLISFRNSADPLTAAIGGWTVGKMITLKNTANITTLQSVALRSTFNHSMFNLLMAMQAVEFTNKTLIENDLVAR